MCLAAAACLACVFAVGCGSTDKGEGGSLPQGSERVKLDPAEFTTQIDHLYWPMSPGNRWVYRETEGGTVQRVVVTVTSKTKRVAGVETRVVYDVVSERGKLVEKTYDWYAQRKDGSLWYLGEDTKEYENGRVASTKGSWQTGVDGAQAGVILPARPRVGMSYRQEYYAGSAEDQAKVLSLDEKVEVPFGSFDHVLETKDYTPVEPKVLEHKYYARHVGPALIIGLSGTTGREELLSFNARGGI